MTDRQLELIKHEQQLNEKEADLVREESKLTRLEEDYFGHFSKANHLFNDIRYLFSGTDDSPFFEELYHDVYQDSRKMVETLSSTRKMVKHQHQTVQKQLDTLYEEKQKISLEEEQTS